MIFKKNSVVSKLSPTFKLKKFWEVRIRSKISKKNNVVSKLSPTSKFKVLGGENRESRFQQKKIVLSQNGLLLLNLKSFGM